jgi:hypothetical protein
MARILTALVWVLAGVFAVLGAVMLASGEGWASLHLLAVGVGLAVMLVVMRRHEPLEYAVEEGAISIRRRSAAPRRFDGIPSRVRRGVLGLRVFGDGGGYGYLGRFRAEGQTVQAFVTDRARVVLLEVGASGLAISPADPDAFVVEVGSGA